MASSVRPKIVRSHPRISATKLGEYLNVAANRRERILRDQKYPSDFITARYTQAANSIRAAMVAGGDVPSRLLEKAQALSLRQTSNKNEERTQACCTQAIRQFARLYPELPRGGVTWTQSGVRSQHLYIEAVDVSVAPLVLVTRALRNGSVETGALILALRKGHKLSDHSGKAVAELVRQGLVAAGYHDVQPKLCLVVDVFGREIFHAPSNHRRLTTEIESACREIASRWPALAA